MPCQLSIIIPAYNVEDFIVSAIKSALNQTLQDLEVIVIDDGSTDSTLERIYSVCDIRIKVLSHENVGLSATRNAGIRASKGEYIGFLDGDDIWYPRKAEDHLALMESDSSIGVTFSYSAYIDEYGKHTGQYLITKIRRPTKIDFILRNHIGNGSNPIVRKDCFVKAGPFDEGLRSCEDYEMWVRIYNKTEYVAQLIPKVLTGYRVRESSLTMNFDVFLNNAMMVILKFESDVPNITTKIKCRAIAEIYRIASRKALSAGQTYTSAKLMRKALSHSHTIIFTDIRAFGTFSLIVIESLLPARLKYLPYKLARKMMKVFYRVYMTFFSAI